MTRITVEEQLGGPEDLREWIEAELLLRFVLEAVQEVAETAPATLPEGTLPAGIPRTLLTVLTYSYAIGLYGSEEIETELRTDPQLLYASANTALSASALRRFRRLHRECLLRSLRAVLEKAWSWRGEVPSHCQFQDQDVHHTWGAPNLVFSWAAERRVHHAVLADSMALDT